MESSTAFPRANIQLDWEGRLPSRPLQIIKAVQLVSFSWGSRPRMELSMDGFQALLINVSVNLGR